MCACVFGGHNETEQLPPSLETLLPTDHLGVLPGHFVCIMFGALSAVMSLARNALDNGCVAAVEGARNGGIKSAVKGAVVGAMTGALAATSDVLVLPNIFPTRRCKKPRCQCDVATSLQARASEVGRATLLVAPWGKFCR